MYRESGGYAVCQDCRDRAKTEKENQPHENADEAGEAAVRHFLLGHQIEVGYFDQELAQFNSANTVLEEVWNDFRI